MTTINLGTAVTTSRTFALVGVRSSPPGGDISSSMVRARLISTTQITIDRQTANYNATEIVWQTIELKDGSKVQGGTNTLGTGTASATPALTAVDAARATAFGSLQYGAGSPPAARATLPTTSPESPAPPSPSPRARS